MRRQKIYLDTSVISHLDQLDAPDKMNDTLVLWEEIKQGLYEVYISEVTMNEVMANGEPKQSTLLEYISEIDYVFAHLTDEIIAYADKIVETEILSDKHYDDCLHIACAVINECHILLSWNFKHIVKVKTVNGIKMVNAMLGYREIGIFPPNMLIERG
ncbi:MAG: PIN domain nuclease [Defluviitaleaceae bacterium]|nr:PIN domain nuclease [Defluviitaleaceae bacterium]